MGLSKTYNPNKYESDIYKFWEENNAFSPEYRDNKDRFSIIMPPPNANANIHLGTAITLGLEDIIVRYHRMLGKSTLFVPGSDHAGIETQFVYEKRLAKEGKSRLDFSRDQLYKQIWDFVEKNKKGYEVQFRKLGVSPDWNRYVYTLDKKIVKRTYATFKQMWDEGLIYRSTRLVNFCTFHGTAFADIEVIHKEKQGYLWYINYPLTDGSGEITVSTTRPETMLGDVAVAVNPKDKRMSKFIGKTAKLPLLNREIPIITDKMVDAEFGTGAVKITPAHDQNDFEVAERHDLPMITVISHEGTMTHEAGEQYKGLNVIEAREKVVNDLKSGNYLAKTQDYTHNVGHCYKCGIVIEPLLREQWFVDMAPLAKKAIKALQDNQIKFYPSQKQDQLIGYLQGLRDWNISRQNAWGIPIPAFCNVNDNQDWIFNDRVDQELIEINGQKYRRDPDVFDTWFSSSSWPYATLNYPDGKDYKEFYPLNLLETGGEILYPWVSRMIMLGLYVTGKVPFKTVYIHGYILAEDGTKMSKSLGNVIDPLPIIESHGSDALRMGLIAGRTPAVNRAYDASKIEGARNFCNKLWNIARYIEGKSSGEIAPSNPTPQTPADHWVLSILQHASKQIGQGLEKYNIAESYELLYQTVWDDIADWYIEATKTQEDNQVMLRYVLETVLKLAHPFAPFVTEAIWQNLDQKPSPLLITSPWPQVPKGSISKVKDFKELQKLVTEVRQLSKNLNLIKPSLTYTTSSLLEENTSLIMQMSGLGSVKQSKSSKGIRLLSAQAWLSVKKSQISAYKTKITDKIKEQKSVVSVLNKRLANKSYVNNAPIHIVTETKQKRTTAESDLELLKAELTRFS